MRAFTGLKGFTVGAITSLLLIGCSSYGIVQNDPTTRILHEESYSLAGMSQGDRSNDMTVILTLSGGGTRAAAMAYGVMEELRDTKVLIDGKSRRLLDEVDHISSVSGGSFAAAYYGLHGDKMFDIFEDEFLRYDLQSALVHSVINPFHWFGKKGRTERAIEMYDKHLFHNATFADMMKPGRPMIIINASDLSHGVRFSFIQDYFNLLCSDISTFPVSRAVTASSAVPVVFNPVVVENFDGCPDLVSKNEESLKKRSKGDPELTALYEGLKSYSNKAERKYIHFVDGGISDNMGLRAMSDVIEVVGGPDAYLKSRGKKKPHTIVLISVNASTEPQTDMGASNKQPSMATSMEAVSSVQLHRYNVATMELVQTELKQWAESISTPERPVNSYFIKVTFDNIQQPQLQLFLNKIPTSFSLTGEQVDKLTDSGRSLLRNEETFQKLLNDLGQP